MSKAQISIIIPVHNRAEVVKITLDSVVNQLLRPLDVILVDNNSTDNTLDVLSEWKQQVATDDFRVTVLNEATPGAPAARNRGLKEVKTPYIMFFDSDDIMSPIHALRAMEAFIAEPDVDVVGWDVDIVELTGKTIRYPFCDKDTLYNHIFHSTFATQRYAIKTDLINRIGGWNESLQGWNDYELGVRILLSNPKIKRLDGDVTVTVVHQTESITGVDFSSKPHKWESSLNAVEQALMLHGRTDMRKYIEVRRAILAGFYAREGRENEARRLMNEVCGRNNVYVGTIMRLFCFLIYKGGRGISKLARLLLLFTH